MRVYRRKGVGLRDEKVYNNIEKNTAFIVKYIFNSCQLSVVSCQ